MQITKEGNPFWSGPKRAPNFILFDESDVSNGRVSVVVDLQAERMPIKPLHMDYIVSGANIRAFNYGLRGSNDLSLFKKTLSNIIIPDFKPKSGLAVQIKDDEPVEKTVDEEETLSDVAATLPAPSTLAGYRMIPAEFEKDDDSNHHIDVSLLIHCAYLRHELIALQSVHNCLFKS